MDFEGDIENSFANIADLLSPKNNWRKKNKKTSWYDIFLIFFKEKERLYDLEKLT